MEIDIAAIFSQTADIEEGTTRQKILNAALEETAAQGLHGLTMEGVARRCRMNRATVYRYFGSREDLQSALLVQEAQKLIRAMTLGVELLECPVEVLTEGFVIAMRFAKDHPVIQRLVNYEPGALLEAANSGQGALLRLGGMVMSQTVAWAQTHGFATHFDSDVLGDLLARLFASYVLMPVGTHAISNEQEARKFATETLIPMLRGH